MSVVFLIMAALAFISALYFLYDFLSWRWKTHVTIGVIEGFSGKKDKGLALPIISFETQDGKKITAQAARIDRLLYLFNRPDKGSFVTISYELDQPERIRIYGYIPLICSGLLAIPLSWAVALAIGSAVLAAKSTFLLIFAVAIMGGWMFLKLIQRSN